MSSIIEIAGHHYNALLANAAVDDVRFYLRGILIDQANDCAVATDGHALIKLPLNQERVESDAEPIIYTLTPKAPVGGSVLIDLGADSFAFHLKNGNQKSKMIVARIDGRYPDYEHELLKKAEPGNTPKKLPPFNPNLVARTAAALKAEGVRFTFEPDATEASPFRAEFYKFPEIQTVIMPMRDW